MLLLTPKDLADKARVCFATFRYVQTLNLLIIALYEKLCCCAVSSAASYRLPSCSISSDSCKISLTAYNGYTLRCRPL
jgi:hypothetical protein